jgi:hypothetical protein
VSRSLGRRYSCHGAKDVWSGVGFGDQASGYCGEVIVVGPGVAAQQ